MKAMEYNTWMTILEYVTSCVETYGSDYITGINVEVKPSYPKNITDINKPAIIVQKVTSKEKKMSLGNFIGQYFDADTDTLVDVDGKMYTTFFDFILMTNGNVEKSLLTDLIIEKILSVVRLELKDYTDPLKPVMGSLTLSDTDIDVTHLSANDLEDYGVMIMVKFSSIRHTVPAQETVDLSKLIKWTQTIRL